MFVNNRAAAAAGGGGVTAADENAILHHKQNATKTPAAKTPKRRAFGDISNRKATNAGTVAIKKTPHVASSIIVPTTTRTKHYHASNIVPPTTRRANQKVTFASLPNNNNIKTTNKKLAPNVEVSAGRVYRDQPSFFDDEQQVDVDDILAEQEAWNTEISAFCEEERTRHLRIRKHRNELAEQELQEKKKALWKQDDDDLAAAGMLDNLVLESVTSFDDLSLGEDSYSFPDDISF